jgi:hypothetical protein
MSWYKDRDFPELKREVQGEPGEILAVIPDPKHLEAVVKAHNEELEEIYGIAETWRDKYRELERKHKIETANLRQTVDQLEIEIKELKAT